VPCPSISPLRRRHALCYLAFVDHLLCPLDTSPGSTFLGGIRCRWRKGAREGRRCRRGWGWRRQRRLVELAVALNDPRHNLLSISLAKVVVLLRLDKLPPAPHSSITLFLDGSFIACHPPLLAGREFAGVWLGEGGGSLRVCSSP
jgi:hypothetical protein